MALSSGFLLCAKEQAPLFRMRAISIMIYYSIIHTLPSFASAYYRERAYFACRPYAAGNFAYQAAGCLLDDFGGGR